MLAKQRYLAALGEKVKKSRLDAGMQKLSDVTAKTGLHRNFLSKIEDGKTNPSAYTLYKLASAIGDKTLDPAS